VTLKSDDVTKSGHIAIVRPCEKTALAIEKDGPDVIQAGKNNHEHVSVRAGFKNHEGAWPGGVKFYVHELKK
jgi:hypothetical protein